jgi:uncharacterized protein
VSNLTINISRLSEGIHQYEFETEPKDLDLDARFVGRISLHVSLEKTGRQMHLKADLRTKGQFECDRCLEKFEDDLTTHFEVVYITEEAAAEGEDGEDVQYVAADATTIDLGEEARQFLILAVPLKLLCRDDCRGLCPKCGSNRNKVKCNCAENDTDPRWEVLKKLSLN